MARSGPHVPRATPSTHLAGPGWRQGNEENARSGTHRGRCSAATARNDRINGCARGRPGRRGAGAGTFRKWPACRIYPRWGTAG